MIRPRLLRLRLTLALAGLVASVPAGAAPPEDGRPDGLSERLDWVRSPYRLFREPRALAGVAAVLVDEADDPSLRASLGAEVRRLSDELYVRQGWRSPFAGDEPLRFYVARRESGGERAFGARAVENGRFVSPAVMLDASGLSTAQIVREASRQVVLATLAAYGGPGDAFLAPSIAEYLSAPAGGEAEGRYGETWMAAASPLLDFRGRPELLGRFWVDEVVRTAGGPVILREAWERAAEGGESPTAVLLRTISETYGQSEEGLLVLAAARLYAGLEPPEPSPSRLRLLDVESGAIDAAAPAALSVRHRAFLPETDETLRVDWPRDGGAGAAVVRYTDAALPPDMVLFGAGDRRAIPLSGVSRIDWLVAGSSAGGTGVAAPVYADLSATVPYNRLEARAAADGDGARLIWTTASHEGLWGWAVFREEVLADGRVRRSGPEIVPSAESAETSFRYSYLDAAAVPGTFYRYTVWAVTTEGLLARAFAATLRAGE